jgi:carbamoyl-phosphate synthase large subunit
MNVKNQNILVLSAGRRVELVQSFKEQRDKLLPSCQIIAVDLRPELSSACHIADQCFSFPHAADESYSTYLLDFCIKHKIGLVIPTIDTELTVLAKLKKTLSENGTTAVISDLQFVKLCRDKYLSGKLFNQIGLRYPEIYLETGASFPAFCKPKDGSSSKDAQLIASYKELLTLKSKNNNLMLMEYWATLSRIYNRLLFQF